MIEYKGFKIYSVPSSKRGKGKDGTFCGEIPDMDGRIKCYSGQMSLEEAYQRGKDLVDEFLNSLDPVCRFLYEQPAQFVRKAQLRIIRDKVKGVDW